MGTIPARRPLGRPRNAPRHAGNFGRALRAHRDARGLTLAQVAALIGVQPSTICRWEAGTALPSGCVRAAVVAALPEMEGAITRDSRKSRRATATIRSSSS